jgi:hypothetical protein
VSALNPQFSCDPKKRHGDVNTYNVLAKFFQRESLASRAAANCENTPDGRKILPDECGLPRSQPIIDTLTVDFERGGSRVTVSDLGFERCIITDHGSVTLLSKDQITML